jgi:hypothetical protein
VLAIIQTLEEKKNKHLRLKLLKNRNEESDVVVEAAVNYDLYTLTDIGEWKPPEEDPQENNSSTSYGNTQAAKSRRAKAGKNSPNNGTPPSGTVIHTGSSVLASELRANLRGGGKK